ncbi:MAG: hypothetical protein EOO50_06675 [Flavobacterium sp.]|uniref:hypothetical protein n=1 Tax=Flavobacterium sp. TaxID=239 RepID=UPI001205C78C|nr:hypothetical protein [Flavobacterium sp.]RZJ67202.1 MAG: hypothetical protein EOO50_06675 [Flavobacterium sp.]
MKSVIIYVAMSLCLFVSKSVAQQTFEDRIKVISDKIALITKEEKSALKEEVDGVNKQLESGQITSEQADSVKLEFAEVRAANIERRTAAAQDELKKLVQEKVEGKVTERDSTRRYRLMASPMGGFKVETSTTERDTMKGENRTTSQLVFAFGLNHFLTDGAMAHSDYRVWGSHFYELGLTANTRLLKNNNLLHLKYGLSMQWNTVRPTDNRYYEEVGEQTLLVDSPVNLGDSRFRNVNLVLPVHLEFDFSGKDKYGRFYTHESFRFGLGGFVGANVKSKRVIEFQDDNNNEVNQKTVGDYNVNNFVYGLSAYVGYKAVSLYCKYDLQPVFEDNAVDQNNISFGVRWDFN